MLHVAVDPEARSVVLNALSTTSFAAALVLY